MTYLVVTAAKRTETIHGSAPITEEENAGVTVADVESLSGKKGIPAVTSQPTATGIIFEVPADLEMAPVTGQVISTSSAEIVAESLEGENSSGADQLFDRRATMRQP